MFIDEFRRVCKEKGTSPTAVLQALGMSTSSVTSWKNGVIPNVGTIHKIADYLEVDIVEFLDGSQQSREMNENYMLGYAQGLVDANAKQPAPISEGGLSEDKTALIEAIYAMSDENVRKLRIIVEQVISERG